MKPESKLFIYTVWRYLLVGPLFAAPIIGLGLIIDANLTAHETTSISPSQYPAALLGMLIMGVIASYVITLSSAFVCALYRGFCSLNQRSFRPLTYYALTALFNLRILQIITDVQSPAEPIDALFGVAGSLFLAYKMLGVRITPVDNPYAHIAPEKQSQPSIFSNIMLLYILGIPAIAALPLTLWFLDPSDGTGRKILGYFVCHLIALVALCPWMPGLYIARCATSKKPVSRKTYYLWALRSGYAVPTLVALLIAIGQLIHHDRFKSIYGFIAGYCNVAVLSMTATVLLSALFLVITERWLKNTPFALQFAKKSPPVSATEN